MKQALEVSLVIQGLARQVARVVQALAKEIPVSKLQGLGKRIRRMTKEKLGTRIQMEVMN